MGELSLSSPPPRRWRILSKQGMECTPAFHNLFPHSSPLHVYKQRPEEGGEGRRGAGGRIAQEPCGPLAAAARHSAALLPA